MRIGGAIPIPIMPMDGHSFFARLNLVSGKFTTHTLPILALDTCPITLIPRYHEGVVLTQYIPILVRAGISSNKCRSKAICICEFIAVIPIQVACTCIECRLVLLLISCSSSILAS